MTGLVIRTPAVFFKILVAYLLVVCEINEVSCNQSSSNLPQMTEQNGKYYIRIYHIQKENYFVKLWFYICTHHIYNIKYWVNPIKWGFLIVGVFSKKFVKLPLSILKEISKYQNRWVFSLGRRGKFLWRKILYTACWSGSQSSFIQVFAEYLLTC